jgi:RHS repeat-associated protein
MRDNSSSVEFLMADPHGTATVSVDGLTTTVSRRFMDPFGNARGTQSPTWEPNAHGFVNGVDDPSTGLVHLGAREYDPKLGRFISVDPLVDIADPQTLNAYAYSNNSPATFSDPDGLSFTGFRGDDGGDGSETRGQSTTTADRQDAENKTGSTFISYKDEDGKEINSWEDVEVSQHHQKVKETKKRIKKVIKDLVKIVADELGITDALNCFTNGDVGACVATGVTILSSFAGGIAGKLVTKYLIHAKKAWKLIGRIKDLVGEAIDGIKGLRKAEDELKAASCVANSFKPGTLVLLADGTRKPIEQLRLGDKVVATDPVTGKTSAEPVVRTIIGQGTKDLVDLQTTTVAADGTSTIAKLTATTGHPFYLPETAKWVDAGDLTPGSHLAALTTPRDVTITSACKYTTQATVYNLTVERVQTYYVLAGAAPVLVHDCGKSVDDLYEKAVEVTPGQGSPAARAYQKHMTRDESSLPVVMKGRDRAAAADDRVADLLTSPKSAVQSWRHDVHGDVIDYLLPDGGARWSKSGNFIGFLE